MTASSPVSDQMGFENLEVSRGLQIQPKSYVSHMSWCPILPSACDYASCFYTSNYKDRYCVLRHLNCSNLLRVVELVSLVAHDPLLAVCNLDRAHESIYPYRNLVSLHLSHSLIICLNLCPITKQLKQIFVKPLQLRIKPHLSLFLTYAILKYSKYSDSPDNFRVVFRSYYFCPYQKTNSLFKV